MKNFIVISCIFHFLILSVKLVHENRKEIDNQVNKMVVKLNLKKLKFVDNSESNNKLIKDVKNFGETNNAVEEELLSSQKKGGSPLTDIQNHGNESLISLETGSGEGKKDLLNNNKNKENKVSTIQYKYVKYYKKIKKTIEKQWDFVLNQNNIGSGIDGEIVVVLKIDQEGKLIKYALEKSSINNEYNHLIKNLFSNINYLDQPPIEIFNSKKYILFYWKFAIN